MAFFTHFCKKCSVFFTFLLLTSFSFAATSSIDIKNADLIPYDDFYSLDAEIEITLDESLIEAVNKGVPLNFLVEFQVVSPRKYWFDDEIETKSINAMLSYYALTKQYLVTRGKHQKSFETLAEAVEELGLMHGWRVLNKSMVEKNEAYNAALLMRLDQTKLPKAIQVEAIGSEKWSLSSTKFEWSLKDIQK
jgi:Domain of unknown function (DUF4390)